MDLTNLIISKLPTKQVGEYLFAALKGCFDVKSVFKNTVVIWSGSHAIHGFL